MEIFMKPTNLLYLTHIQKLTESATVLGGGKKMTNCSLPYNTSSSESLYSLIELDHGISQIFTSLEWCKRAITTLKLNKQKTNVGAL